MSHLPAIRANDSVQVLIGKDRGKKGKVTQVLRSEGLVVVEGLNVRTKNVRPRRSGEKGQRIEFHAPMNISNVMLICPKCNKLTRVGLRVTEHDGKRVKERTCKKCHEVIP